MKIRPCFGIAFPIDLYSCPNLFPLISFLRTKSEINSFCIRTQQRNEGAESEGENKRGVGGRSRAIKLYSMHLSGPSRAIKLLYAPAPPPPRYVLSKQERTEWAKKPSHATIPLRYL
jgi:hypothetical protein